MTKESYIPTWWHQALAVEYLPCRDFSKGDRIAAFDFSRVTKEMMTACFLEHSIVSFGTVVHNVDSATYSARSLFSLFSSVVRPVVNKDKFAIYPQGVVSEYNFPHLTNPIDVCDPIESFGSHIQVLDNGVLYQWEIAAFEGVEGRHYGRWTSDYTDLSEFDKTYDEFQNLMRYKSGKDFVLETYVARAQAYIEHLQRLRMKAFVDLKDVHEDLKRKDKTSRKKVVPYKPPALSHFETMEIKDGEIYTTCFIAPIFYRAALKHCMLALEKSKGVIHPHVLDEIYEERAQAIIMAVACLEAIANDIGNTAHTENWSFLQRLTLVEKLQFMYSACTRSVAFDKSKHPFQFLLKLVGARNEMIHFKSEYSKCKVVANSAVSKMESVLGADLIEKLPSVLSDSIKHIYSTLQLPNPEWVTNQVGWKVTG
jgi:hypothetical protein